MTYDPNRTPTEEFPTIPTLTLAVEIDLCANSTRTIVHMPHNVSLSTDIKEYTPYPTDPVTRVTGLNHRWILLHRRVTRPTKCTIRCVHNTGKVLELNVSFEKPAPVK